MEIIAELEPSERGVYCGAIGYWSVTGALDSSIAIRTAVALDGRVYFSAGGGIVADSDPEQEYRETLDKARGMIDALRADRMILLIDNYDSFVHNLARYVRELGGEAVVRRNDEVTLADDRGARAEPHHPVARPVLAGRGRHLDRPRAALRADDPDSRRVPRPSVHRRGVRRRHRARRPAGARQNVARRARRLEHLRRTAVAAPGRALPLARHRARIAAALAARDRASAGDDGEIMAVEHRTHPVVGVQFHPESAASEYGYAMLDRFLHGDRSRTNELPNRADGVHADAQARRPRTPPWAARGDDAGGAFVPPPVELVR